eukprot:5955301-Amphidinium_carterae.2
MGVLPRVSQSIAVSYWLSNLDTYHCISSYALSAATPNDPTASPRTSSIAPMRTCRAQTCQKLAENGLLSTTEA